MVVVEKQRVHGASVQLAGENDGTVLERSDDVLSARRRLLRPERDAVALPQRLRLRAAVGERAVRGLYDQATIVRTRWSEMMKISFATKT